jgi:hypothetical protein
MALLMSTITIELQQSVLCHSSLTSLADECMREKNATQCTYTMVVQVFAKTLSTMDTLLPQ